MKLKALYVLTMMFKSYESLFIGKKLNNINELSCNLSDDATEKMELTASNPNGYNIDVYTGITEMSCLQITQHIRAMDLTIRQQQVVDEHSKPVINIHIQSGGGALLPSFYVCDFIKNSKTPIHTYIDGYCASAASLISVCGQKRYMTEHSSMLIHQLRGSTSGKFSELKTEMSNLNFFMDNVRDIYLKNTKLNETLLEELLSTDVWLDAKTCLEYGLVDEIITPRQKYNLNTV